MGLLNQKQDYRGVTYNVLDLIEASKELEVLEIIVKDINIDYGAPCDNNMLSFIEHYKMVENSELKYPIILSPDNFILDGKHRVIKAWMEKRKFIKAVRFTTMPNCGESIE